MAEPAPVALEREARDLSARLPPLLVEARRVAATVAAGMHGRRRAGPGETFWQFRRYQPGDPVQAIDWRRSARSDPVYVRETEWSAAQAVWLWADSSPSMRWRSSRRLPEKGGRAALLALALAVLLDRGGERVALLGGGARPSAGRAMLTRLARELADPQPGGGVPAADVDRHAQLVLLGDFLAPPETLETALRRLAQGGARGHLVQVTDPAEESLPYNGRVRFAGLEGEGEMLASRVEDLRDDYVERLTAHRAALAELARRLGWTFAVHHTDQPAQAPLLALHALLSGR